MISIGGFQRLSLINYPGKVAAVLFLNGCPFRCRFCFNPGLVSPPYEKCIPKEAVIRDIRLFRWALEGVVVTGGEPCMQPELPEFLLEIKQLGFLIKLDTCGYFPEMLSNIIERRLADYVAMDIKAPFSKYRQIVQTEIKDERLRQSIRLILDSGIAYEFRSTLVSGVHQGADIREMARQISGASRYYLQTFRPQPPMVDPFFLTRTAPPMEEMKKEVAKSGAVIGYCGVRQ